MGAFGAILRLPIGFYIGLESLIFLGVVAGEAQVADAEAVFGGVEAHGGLTLGGLG
jgi:hypothetical protein